MLRLGVGQIINHCRAFKSGSVYSASGSIHKAMAHINISWAATRINMSTMISKTTLKPQKVLSLTSVQLPKGAEKKKKRLGRGGQGRTGGRGRKGWKAKHSQNRPSKAFQGGQSTLAKKIPKIGVQLKSKLTTVHKNLRPIRMDKLQFWIDCGRLDASKKITIKDICESGVAGRVKEGVVLLATGSNFLRTKVDIQVTKASQTAIRAIEALGGSVTAVYTDKEYIRSLFKPHEYSDLSQKIVIPSDKKLLALYADQSRRGYLAKHLNKKTPERLVESILTNANEK